MAKKKSTTMMLSFDHVDQALLTLGQKEAFLKHEDAVLNDAMQRLRDESEKKTQEARATKAKLEQDIEIFCVENKFEFEKKRSIELAHGTVSFRTAKPHVAQLNRKYSWLTILELVKKFSWSRQYLRVKEEVDKEAILADSASGNVTDEKLAAIGVKIDQREDFSIDIRWETISDK
jgi:phage host-nuclease inhibitor protein Gam